MKFRIRAISLCLGVFFLCSIASLGIVFGQKPVKKPIATPATKSRDIQIVVIVDNYPHKTALDTEAGFSCLVRGTEKTILFDTGPSDRTVEAGAIFNGNSKMGDSGSISDSVDTSKPQDSIVK